MMLFNPGRSYAALFAPALATALLLGSSPAPAHVGHGEEIDLEIIAGDFYFRAAGQAEGEPIHIPAGESLLIRFVNEGAIEHEFHFGRGPMPEKGLHEVNLFGPTMGDRHHPHSEHGFLGLELPGWDGEGPKPEVVVHVQVPRGMEGEWEIACFITGHYEAGQHLVLVVED